MKLSRVIEQIDSSADGLTPALLEREVDTFVIDSREIKAGDVFFALSQPEYRENGFNGDFDDATVFVPKAFEQGAAACVIRRDRFSEHLALLEGFEDRLVFVDDCIAALQQLAHSVYLEWNKSVVAITGSAGKTTAKELAAHVLSSGGLKVLRNIKNYNNGLGLPLTVLNLVKDESYDVAVLEMGMSTPMNEIQRLCNITPPDVAVVLNVLPVHIEHLGSIENIAKAKGEIIEGLKPGGTAILNADDEWAPKMVPKSGTKVLKYSMREPADVMATDIVFESFGNTRFTLNSNGESSEVLFPLNGEHNIQNALSAAGVGLAFGMDAKAIAKALSTARPPAQRGEVLIFKAGFTVINDSYNSNPAALLSMVETLVSGSNGKGRRIVVAGEMLELGPQAEAQHIEAGKRIAGSGADILIGVRGLAKPMTEGARNAGMEEVIFAEDADSAGKTLASMVQENDVILVKGSRGVRTEHVIEKLKERFEVSSS